MTPKYEIIYDTLLEQIRTGALRADERLPGEDALSQEYGVSLITIRRAMSLLAQEGRIRRVRGQGSFVNRRPEVENQKREHVVALMLNHDNNAAVSVTRIITGMQQALSAHGYQLLVDWNVLSQGIDRAGIDRMLVNNVEGFLIYPFNPVSDEKNYAYIRQKGVPYVLLDRYDYQNPCEFVGANNFDGGMMAARALIERKHEKIACCVNLFFLSSEQERYAGFRCACARTGLREEDICLLHGKDFSKLSQVIRERQITGLFCVSDRIAAHAIQALTAQGLRVPEDVSVIGFDDCLYDVSVNFPFASVRQDFIGIGRVAAERLLSLIAGETPETHTKTLVDVSLIARESSLAQPNPEPLTPSGIR